MKRPDDVDAQVRAALRSDEADTDGPALADADREWRGLRAGLAVEPGAAEAEAAESAHLEGSLRAMLGSQHPDHGWQPALTAALGEWRQRLAGLDGPAGAATDDRVDEVVRSALRARHPDEAWEPDVASATAQLWTAAAAAGHDDAAPAPAAMTGGCSPGTRTDRRRPVAVPVLVAAVVFIVAAVAAAPRLFTGSPSRPIHAGAQPTGTSDPSVDAGSADLLQRGAALAPGRVLLGTVDITAVASDRRARAVGRLLDGFFSAGASADWGRQVAYFDPASNIRPDDAGRRQAYITDHLAHALAQVVSGVTVTSITSAAGGDVIARVSLRSTPGALPGSSAANGCVDVVEDETLRSHDDGRSYLVLDQRNVSLTGCGPSGTGQ